jgi:hypothetical protein
MLRMPFVLFKLKAFYIAFQDKFDYWQSLIVERVDMVMHSEIAESMCNPSLEVCLERVVNNFNNCSMYSVSFLLNLFVCFYYYHLLIYFG